MKAYFTQMLVVALIVIGVVGFIVGNTLLTANSYKNYIIDADSIITQTNAYKNNAMIVVQGENISSSARIIENLLKQTK